MTSWSGRRVLVTGAGGFIGSHLVEALHAAGARVRALVHYNALGTCGWLEQSSARDEIEIFPGDVRDPESAQGALENQEVVFHLAALIAIPYSYQAPHSYVDTNVKGTLIMLQAALKADVQRFVHTSTSEVYGSAQYVPIDEQHPLVGQSPYSASKIGADKMAEAYHRSFGLPVVTVRPFNTFGPRQSARAIVPTIVTQALEGQRIKLGNVHPTRDLNYVTDTVHGFMLAAEKEEAVGQTLNLGSGTEISIGSLAALIAEKLNTGLDIQTEQERTRPSASEVDRLLADARRAEAILGWCSTVSLGEGLDQTISWIRSNRHRFRAGAYAV